MIYNAKLPAKPPQKNINYISGLWKKLKNTKEPSALALSIIFEIFGEISNNIWPSMKELLPA